MEPATANNTLTGNDGANRLTGGEGNDTLAGGLGNDRYVFQRGDGQDVVTDAQGHNQIAWGAGIGQGDVDYSLQGADLVIAVQMDGQALRIALPFEIGCAPWTSALVHSA
jgi:Ca2+-binding RTX toxin-like protein